MITLGQMTRDGRATLRLTGTRGAYTVTNGGEAAFTVARARHSRARPGRRAGAVPRPRRRTVARHELRGRKRLCVQAGRLGFHGVCIREGAHHGTA